MSDNMPMQGTEINQAKAKPQAKVLLIDDSSVVRKAGGKMLSKNFDVITAEDGQQGLALIESETDIQVVFTDLQMPLLDGYGVITAMRSHTDERIKNLPLIVITGADAGVDALKQKVLEMGATDFITKPFKSADINARAAAHSQYQQVTKELKEHISDDVITGLKTKASFDARLKRIVSSVYRHQHELSVLKVSLRHETQLFSAMPEQLINSISKIIAKVIKASVRQEDSTAHAGHANFYIALPHSTPEGAQMLAERICKSVSQLRLTIKGEALHLVMSVGICSVQPGHRVESTAILSRVEELFQQAVLADVEQKHLLLAQPTDAAAQSVASAVSIDELLSSMSETTPDIATLQQAYQQLSPLLDLFKQHLKP